MARIKRNPIEAELDRLFVQSLFQKAGTEISGADVTKLLNSRRAASARETAIALGESEEDAEAAAQEAKLARQTVGRDIRIVHARIRRGADGRAAVFLDDQAEQCERDIEGTYRDDDLIRGDLERSRRETKTISRGPAPEVGQTGRPVEIVRSTSESAARAELWNSLGRNYDRRVKLRAELRSLAFGRDLLGEVEAEEQTFAQVVTGESDPRKARTAALDAYAKEIDYLSRIEHLEIGPTSPELARMQRLRLQRHASRVRMIREFVDLSGDGEGAGRFEIRVLRIKTDGGPPKEAAG